MRKLVFILTILFISCNNSVELKKSDEKTGKGIIYLDPNSPIELFKNENDKVPFDSIVFAKNKVFDKGSYKIKSHSIRKVLNPYELYLGDSEQKATSNENKGLIEFKPKIAFNVLEHKNNSFKIVLNNQTKDYCYIRTDNRLDLTKSDYLSQRNFDPNFVPDSLSDWHLYESWAIHLRNSLISNKDLKFFDQPKNGKELKSNSVIFDTIVGDWAKFILNSNQTGWTRWKENDSILINYQRFMYY